MGNRTIYHVTPHGYAEWQVIKENAERASSLHDRKAEAIERARELAKQRTDSQVIIHKRDGTIQREYTYGHDPMPPEG